MNDMNKQREEYKAQGYALIQYDDKALHSYPYDAPWMLDEKFNTIYENIRKNTLVDRIRCFSHYQLLDQVRNVPGDILEVGTWRGGTAGIFAQMAPNKTIYLADTFEGVVKSADWEHYQDKAHSDTSEELVVNFLKDDLKVNNYKILKGIFPEDTGENISDVSFSYVHIDVDVYQSAKDIFNYVWKNVSQYGIVVFDDYGFISACSGIYKFVNEIKNDDDKIFIQGPSGHAYVIKR